MHLPDRRKILAVALGTSLLPASAIARVDSTEDATGEAIRKVLEGSSAVAVGGAVWREGRLLWKGQGGLRETGKPATVGPDDKWHIGSNTKAMTAAIWARLVEQGKAAWDMPLAEAVRAAGLDVQLNAKWGAATVDDFMRHRAGLSDGPWINLGWLLTSRADNRPLPVQRADLAKRILEAGPTLDYGTHQYGNANYILVGALIEGLSGMAWEDVMREQMFAPLGMTSAGFGAPLGDNPQGHEGNARRIKAVPATSPQSDNPAALGPAGTVHLTLDDYGRYLQAMMAPGWLSADSLTRLLTPLEGEDYGLGWGVLGSRGWAKGTAYMHNGSNTMWFSTVAIDPAGQLAIATVSNDGVNGQRACNMLIGEMLKNVTPSA